MNADRAGELNPRPSAPCDKPRSGDYSVFGKTGSGIVPGLVEEVVPGLGTGGMVGIGGGAGGVSVGTSGYVVFTVLRAGTVLGALGVVPLVRLSGFVAEVPLVVGAPSDDAPVVEVPRALPVLGAVGTLRLDSEPPDGVGLLVEVGKLVEGPPRGCGIDVFCRATPVAVAPARVGVFRAVLVVRDPVWHPARAKSPMTPHESTGIAVFIPNLRSLDIFVRLARAAHRGGLPTATSPFAGGDSSRGR
jgi:hypothetical protein